MYRRIHKALGHFAWYPRAYSIFTDRGTQFSLSLWLSMCNYLGAQRHHATAYHPQAQGQIECLGRTLKNSLRCQDNANEWYGNLPWALMALRNSSKEDLGNFSPLNLCFITPYDSPKADPDAFVSMCGHYVTSLHFMPPRQPDKPSYPDKNLFSPATTPSVYEWTLIVPPCNPYIKTPTKCSLNFPSILNSTCGMA